MNAVNPVQSSIAPGDHATAAEPSMEEILASIRRIIADDQSFPGHPHAGMPAPEASPSPDLDAPDLDAPGAPPAPVSDAHEAPPAPEHLDAPEASAGSAPADSVTGDEAMHVPHMPEPHLPEPQTPAPEAAAPHDVGHPAPVESVDAVASEHGVHAPQFATPDGPSHELPNPPAAPDVAGMGSVDEDLEAALAGVIPPEPEPSAEPAVAPHDREPPAAPDALFSPAIDSSVTTAFNTLAASRLVANADELRGLVREMIRPLLKTWIEEHLPGVVERLVAAEIERIARG